jgi:hypothetical protein
VIKGSSDLIFQSSAFFAEATIDDCIRQSMIGAIASPPPLEEFSRLFIAGLRRIASTIERTMFLNLQFQSFCWFDRHFVLSRRCGAETY